MPVGIGAHQLAGDLGAEYRRGHHAHIVLQRGQIETGEVIQLQPIGIGQHRLQVGRGIAAPRREAHKMLIPPPIGDLNEAQAVSRGDEPHGFGVDGNGAIGQHALGEIFFVEINSHARSLTR